jgi:hypothetical protein
LHYVSPTRLSLVKRSQTMTAPEKKIAQRIHDFDLISLLHLLQFLSYRPEEIQFKSHFSASSQPSLLQKIEFHSEPTRGAIITLNMGLLSAQSPLPSYFLKMLDTGDFDNRSFVDFIGYFDHSLIKEYLLNIYPEMNEAFYPDWEMTKRRFVQLLDLKSCSTLHWLFQLVFPELGVRARKALLDRQLQMTQIRLGETILGTDAIFGGKASIPIYGRRITLFSELDTTGRGEPWPKVIKHRLEDLIFPILRSVGMDIEILLIIRTQKTWVKLHSESYLGYDKMRGGQEQYRRIRIFTGRLRDG